MCGLLSCGVEHISHGFEEFHLSQVERGVGGVKKKSSGTDITGCSAMWQ